MKPLFDRLTAAAVAAGIAMLFFAALQQPAKKIGVHSVQFSLGVKEDPRARLTFEWNMLRSPQTGEIPQNIHSRELEFAKRLPSKELLLKRGLLRKGEVATWTYRGPVNQGGRTRALAIDVSNESILLAGGVSGGMWRSINGGTSWTRVSSIADSIQSVTCIAQDTRTGKTTTWYYGTGEWLGNSARGGGAFYAGDGIYKSTNGGVTWTSLPVTRSYTPQPPIDHFFEFVWNIAIDTSNSSQDEVYAATLLGVLRSTDGGTNWSVTRGAYANNGPQFTDVSATTTGVVYAAIGEIGFDNTAAVNSGIWRSTDGITWTDITPSVWPLTTRRVVLDVARSNENIVYFLAETPGSGVGGHSLWKYTFLSGDGSGTGGQWEDRSANIPMIGGDVGDFDSQGSYDLIIKVKPNNADVVFIGGTNLYRSTNGFSSTAASTWIGGYSTANDVSQYANHHPDQHSLVFLPSNVSIMISGHDGGLSRTSNNLASTVTWTSLNNGYNTTQFYSLAIDPATAGDPVIVGGMQDNGNMLTTSSSGSVDWDVLPFGGDGCFSAIADGKARYHISAQEGLVFRLTIVAGVVTDWACLKPSGATNFLFVTPYLLEPSNQQMMYLAAGDRIWRNSDVSTVINQSFSPTATNWTELTSTAAGGSAVTALGVSKIPASRLYYGTQDGKVLRIDGANSGQPTPTNVSTGIPVGAYVSCIAVNPRNADTSIVVLSNYEVPSLFLTTNGGSTWTDISGNLEEDPSGAGAGPSCRWATILPSGGTVSYYVATSIGLYSTTSLSGSSTVWVQEGSSVIGNVVTTMVVSRPADGLVAAATHGNGVFSATFVTSVSRIPGVVPTEFKLMQNFPNPFNPTTDLRYSIPERGNVRLRVYDATGKHVATLVEEHQDAGMYEATWDARTATGTVSSGVYFARLEHGGRVSTQKMMLLK